MQTIPKYIITALSRAEYHFGKDCVAGYSIKIYKRTRYEWAQTLKARANQIVAWANRQVEGSAEIVHIPAETRHDIQFAVITIYDPVMLNIEKYIKK